MRLSQEQRGADSAWQADPGPRVHAGQNDKNEKRSKLGKYQPVIYAKNHVKGLLSPERMRVAAWAARMRAQRDVPWRWRIAHDVCILFWLVQVGTVCMCTSFHELA